MSDNPCYELDRKHQAKADAMKAARRSIRRAFRRLERARKKQGEA